MRPEKKHRCCGYCLYFEKVDVSFEDREMVVGNCHRYPPTGKPLLDDNAINDEINSFPFVSSSEWCAEWSSRSWGWSENTNKRKAVE